MPQSGLKLKNGVRFYLTITVSTEGAEKAGLEKPKMVLVNGPDRWRIVLSRVG